MQVGCGADELIDLLMRCVLDPGDSILDTPPTFTMYKFDAAVNNAKVITVSRKADFSIDVPGWLRLAASSNPGYNLLAPAAIAVVICRDYSSCTAIQAKDCFPDISQQP